MGKKLLGLAFLAFLVFFIAKQPHDAANVVKTLAGGILEGASGFATFLIALFT
jgi:hypothetical protein